MLRNISVRSFISGFLLIVLVLNAGVMIAISKNIPLFIAVNSINALALIILWLYMTKYLVTPINTVKNSIEEVTAGNLALTIPEFGNNCAG